MSDEIASLYPLSSNLRVTCVEASRHLHELIRDNPRAGDEETPNSIMHLLGRITTTAEVTQDIELEIRRSRRTRNYKQACLFASDASQLVPGTVHRDLRVLDIINYDAGTSRTGGSSRPSESSRPGVSSRIGRPSRPGVSSRTGGSSMPSESSRTGVSSRIGRPSRPGVSSRTGGSSMPSESSRTGRSSRIGGPSRPGGSSRIGRPSRLDESSRIGSLYRTVGLSRTLRRGGLSRTGRPPTTGGSVPTYFKPLFECSWGDLTQFENFIRSTEAFLQIMMTQVMKGIADCVETLHCWFQSPEFRSGFDDDQQRRVSMGYMDKLLNNRSRLKVCEDRMKIKFRPVYGSRCALNRASEELSSAISIDTANKVMKLRDYFYYSLEEYEKTILQTLRVIREIYSE